MGFCLKAPPTSRTRLTFREGVDDNCDDDDEDEDDDDNDGNAEKV